MKKMKCCEYCPRFSCRTILWIHIKIRRHDTQHNDIQRINTQQHDTQHKDIQHNIKWIAPLSIMALAAEYAECHLCWMSFMISVPNYALFTDCNYAECRYAECHYAEYCSAKNKGFYSPYLLPLIMNKNLSQGILNEKER